MAIPTVTVTGPVLTAGGAPVASGTVVATLSAPGGTALDGVTTVSVGAPVTATLVNGQLTIALVPNDAIVPSGTFHRVWFYTHDALGVPYRWSEKWQIPSGPALDLGSVPRLGVVPGVAVAATLAGTQAQADAAAASQASATASAAAALAARGGAEAALFPPTQRTKGAVCITEYGAVSGGGDALAAVQAADAVADDTGAAVLVPPGAFTVSAEPTLVSPVRVEPGGFLLDANTGDRFVPQFTSRGAALRDAWRDRDRRTIRTLAPKVVCFGDSNTRYYVGDTSTPGPFGKAACAHLDVLAGKYPALWQATFTNRGFPGEDAQYGIDQYAANVTGYAADIVVYGWGTNDIKLAGASLETYIGKMQTLIALALAGGVVPIVMGIPWFHSGYGADGVLSQQRLPVWNNRLRALCEEYAIDFIDTYSMFKEDPSFFNEASAKRHYTASAQRIIADRIMAAILGHVTMFGPELQRPAIFREQFNADDLGEVKSGLVYVEGWNIGGRRFRTLRITNGKSLTLSAAGRWVVAFYPRQTATGTIVDGGTTNVSIVTAADAGEFYPVQRYASAAAKMGTSYDLVITATSGDLYLRYYGIEDPPAPPVTGTAPLLRYGAGSPEAAVTAPIGSLWMRTDGGAVTTLYVKESGTGNTGWIAK